MVNMILAAGEPWISLAGLYRCQPDQLDAGVSKVVGYYDLVRPDLPGLVGTAIHLMAERTGFFTLSQWEDEETLGKVVHDTNENASLREVIAECHPEYIPCRTSLVQLPVRRAKGDILCASGLQLGDPQAQTNLAILRHSAEEADAVRQVTSRVFAEAAKPVSGFWGVAIQTALNKAITLCLSQWESIDAYESMVRSSAYAIAFAPLNKLARIDRYWFNEVRLLTGARTRPALH